MASESEPTQENLIKSLLDSVFAEELLWGMTRMRRENWRGGSDSTTLTAVSKRYGLVVKIQVIADSVPQPEEYSNTPLRDLGLKEKFDMDVHWHRIVLTLSDPAYRWGKKSVLGMSVDSIEDPFFYQYFKDLYLRCRKAANVVSDNRAYVTNLSFVRKALQDIVMGNEPDTIGPPQGPTQ